MKNLSLWLCKGLMLFGTLVSTPTFASSSHNHCPAKDVHHHQIQLQLFDTYGLPVDGTQFWVDLAIIKKGSQVTIQLPLINFVTGPYANASVEPPPLPHYLAVTCTPLVGFFPPN